MDDAPPRVAGAVSISATVARRSRCSTTWARSTRCSIRRDTLEATIDELLPGSPWADTVARLRCLRGIDTLSAVGLCAEIGDWSASPKAGQVMSYLGLVPSEDTHRPARAGWARSRRPAAGTAAGCLVEAAWHYRRAPRSGQALKRRQAGQPAHVDRDQLAGAAAPASHLAAPGRRARQAPHARRGRRRTRARRLLLGDRATPTDPARTTSVKEAAGTSPALTRESIRGPTMSNRHQAATLDPRQRALTTKHRSCAAGSQPGSAHISLTARRAHAGPAAPLTDTMPATARASGAGALDKRASISVTHGPLAGRTRNR